MRVRPSVWMGYRLIYAGRKIAHYTKLNQTGSAEQHKSVKCSFFVFSKISFPTVKIHRLSVAFDGLNRAYEGKEAACEVPLSLHSVLKTERRQDGWETRMGFHEDGRYQSNIICLLRVQL